MQATRTIFVATDLSPLADEALRQAAEWAGATGARLVVCHVVPAVVAPRGDVPDELGARLTEKLNQRVEEATGRKSGQFELLIEQGVPYAVIAERAEERKADLVVVGSRGASGLERLLLGSVAEKIIRYAHAPVLVARPHARTGLVLACVDFSAPSLAALSTAAEIATRRDARLTAIHSLDIAAWGLSPGIGVPSEPALDGLSAQMRQQIVSDAEARLKGAVAQLGVKAEAQLASGPAAAAVVRAAEKLDADLIVVATRGLTGLRRLLLGSVAEAIARSAPCSVLVARSAAAD